MHRVFENRVLKKVFGPKRDKITVGWGRPCNEVLHDKYFSPNSIQVIR
jgi:hypothetical protein